MGSNLGSESSIGEVGSGEDVGSEVEGEGAAGIDDFDFLFKKPEDKPERAFFDGAGTIVGDDIDVEVEAVGIEEVEPSNFSSSSFSFASSSSASRSIWFSIDSVSALNPLPLEEEDLEVEVAVVEEEAAGEANLGLT